jgi:carboxyl-terminal processing protease
MPFALPAAGWAGPIEPDQHHEQIAAAVAGELTRHHVSRRALDDEISGRCLELFLERLDPWRLYFNQSDVDSLRLQRSDLDDQVRRGNVDFAFTAHSLLLKRIDQRQSLVDELLAVEHDFTSAEEIVIDADLHGYAQDEADARDRWRKRIKFDLLLLRAGGMKRREAVERLKRRYRRFAEQMRNTRGDELLEMYLTALARAFDPHSAYLSPEAVPSIPSGLVRLTGIGVALRSEGGYPVVTEIIPGGAAYREGRLRVQDRLLGIGQGVAEPVEDVVLMNTREVAQLLRGRPDTVVRLEVLPAGSLRPRRVNVTRRHWDAEAARARAEVFQVQL